MPIPERLLGAAILLLSATATGTTAMARDVPFVPTPEAVVEEMLRLAEVGPDDLLYDLGSGDGRIVVTAAQKYGARGVGVDIDPERVAEGRDRAQRAGVANKVRFIEGDLFNVDLRQATAVTLYLLPAINLRLRPKLLDELRPGTPVVSHDFDMGDWEPEQKVNVGRSVVYLWHIPARVAGTWEYRVTGADGRQERHKLRLTQQLQRIEGTVSVDGKTYEIQEGRVDGERLRYNIIRPINGKTVAQHFDGRISGGRIVDLTAALGDKAATQASFGQRVAQQLSIETTTFGNE